MANPAPSDSAQRETRFTLIGIMLGLFLAALDQTIVSTALPRIVSDLQGADLYAWVTTSYLLTSTIAAPIFGRLTELYSRKSILIIAVVMFLAGSALCGLAQTMEQLIVFRGIQGLGGGALFALAFTTIALLFPPRERGRVGGLFGAVFGISSAVGPWLGGLLTDAISWHWVFYINMPVGALALTFIGRFMPRLNPESRQTFDFWGAALLVLWTVPLMLAFSWGGNTYAWDSVQVLGSLALSLVALIIWIWSQYRIKHPLFDLSVLRIRTFSLSAVASFFYGPAFLGAVAFLPLYLQVVKGVSASSSGVSILPLTLGVILGSVGSGILSGRIGRYKPILVVGSLWLAVLFVILHFVINVDTPLWLAIGLFLLLGLGLGPSQSMLQIAAQNDVPLQRLGSATSAIQFVRQIGSTIGIAVLGTVLANTLQAENCKAFPENAACQPGAVVQRGGIEASQGTNLDEVFARTETLIVAALKGDLAAYDTLKADTSLPKEQLANLTRGGIPAQFAALEGQFAAALAGDATAIAALQANPTLPDQLKLGLTAEGLPPQARQTAMERIKQALAQAQTQALEEVPTRVVTQLRETRDKLKTALNNGITQAEKDIFLYATMFVVISLVFIFLLPNDELRGGGGFGGRPAGQAPPAAH